MKKSIKTRLFATVTILAFSIHFVAFTNYGIKTSKSSVKLTRHRAKKNIDIGFFTINNQQFRAYGDGSGNITEIDAYTVGMVYIAPVDSFNSATYITSPREEVTANIFYSGVEYTCHHLMTYE